MEADFWHQKWAKGETGFHQNNVNPLLAAHFDEVKPPAGSRLFVPLCGKTRDIAWLLAKGYPVAGAELSETAVKALFDDLKLTPQVSRHGALSHYQTPMLDVWVGDIFALSPQRLGQVDWVYDRAALVAMPAAMRADYVRQLKALSANAPQLLITMEYDQRALKGPPFAVMPQEVASHYGATHRLTLITQEPLVGGFKGVKASEALWQLTKL